MHAYYSDDKICDLGVQIMYGFKNPAVRTLHAYFSDDKICDHRVCVKMDHTSALSP